MGRSRVALEKTGKRQTEDISPCLEERKQETDKLADARNSDQLSGSIMGRGPERCVHYVDLSTGTFLAHVCSWTELFKFTLPVVTSLDILRILMQYILALWKDFNTRIEMRKKEKSLKIYLF